MTDGEPHGIWGLLLFTALYGGIAAGSAVGAAATTGWVSWVLDVAAAIFSAVTLWMLPLCAFCLTMGAMSVVDRFRRGGEVE